MPPRFQHLFPSGRGGSSLDRGALDSEGNLTVRLRVPRGLYRFYFEAERGTFDPEPMFFNVNGVRVGPSTQFFRVPGMTDASPTRPVRRRNVMSLKWA